MDAVDHLSQISTSWSMLAQAHGEGEFDAQRQARATLLQSYQEAVLRYLQAALGHREAAEELGQEFALRFVRGDFRRASPDKGRFRDYLKTSLFHMIKDYYRTHRVQPVRLDTALAAVVGREDESIPGPDAEFVQEWRTELLNHAWQRLKELSTQAGQSFYQLLRWRSEQPALSSRELGAMLERETGKQPKETWIRKQLHQARTAFAVLLVREVRATLREVTDEELESELIELGLYEYCRHALEKADSS